MRGGQSQVVAGGVSAATVASKITLELSCRLIMFTDSEGQGLAREHWGWLVSNPQCLGLSWEDLGAGWALTAGQWNHPEAWSPTQSPAWRTRNQGLPSWPGLLTAWRPEVAQGQA